MKRSKLSVVSLACCFLFFSGCAALGDLRGTIERFPVGTVLDAAQQVYCAVSKCTAPAVPVPAPEVKP